MKYSIVIPTYNHCDDLLKPCIESILKYTSLDNVELVIAANGCTDETESYLKYLKQYFLSKKIPDNFKGLVCDQPLGYARAVNEGIKHCTGDRIVLLNNDTVLLKQSQNEWLDVLNSPFNKYSKCGISTVHKMWSGIVDRHFASFFCVMIDRYLVNTIGLLDEEFGIGTCEDIDYCIRAENAGFEVHQCTDTWLGETTNSGNFPILHHGGSTLNDSKLIPINVTSMWFQNCIKVGKKHNTPWYKWYISNHVNMNQ
jgi:GT2 family glycosyltransferase